MLGRGVGIHEKQKIMGICIEPEKEIVLSVTYPDKKDAILEAIVRAAKLNESGTGIAFVVPVEKVVGVVHRVDSNCTAWLTMKEGLSYSPLGDTFSALFKFLSKT